MRGRLLSGMLAAGVAACPAADALAQSATPGAQTYSSGSTASMNDLLAAGSRQAAQGIRMGSFVILPTVGATAAYDDNVFARPANQQGDMYTNLDAEIDVVSNWSRHALELYAGAGGNFYKDFESEDKGYARAGMSGRLDVTRDLWLIAYAKYAFGFEARGAGESFPTIGGTFAEPIETQTFNSGALIHKAFNRLWTELGGSVRRQTYFDARLVGGGSVDQSFRDGTVSQVIGRAGYEFSPKTSAFLESVYDWRNYEDNRFDGEGYKLLAGVRYELTRLINAEVAVGYLHQNSAGLLDDIDTWTLRAQLRYDITPLLSAGLVGSRDTGSPSQFATGSNRIESEIGVRADYLIRRDVTLMAGVGYGWVDYVDTTREDEYVRFTTGAEYQMRPWLSLWANYSFLQYDSDVAPSIDYDKNLFFVGLSARY